MIAGLLGAALLDETARAAASFERSVGIVTHFAYWDTPYGNRYDEVERRLVALGVRHVRDTVVIGQTLVCDRERMLASRGVRFDYVTQTTTTAGDIAAWAACVGSAVEAFEAPNEYDISHPASDTDWSSTLRAFQKTLYEAVKTTPATHTLPVIGPSLTSAGAFRQVGDVSAYLDYGNMHDYFAAREPETTGWGDGGYGSIVYNLNAAAPVSGSKPIMATESGYGTSDAHGDVTEDVQAAYVPRLFLDQFVAGVARTYEYELLDEGPEPYGRFGLLRSDLSPKPAYVALQSLIEMLSDASTMPQRIDRLHYSIESKVAGVRHALFEKHDGSFYLALWLDRSSIDPDRRVVRAGEPCSLSVRTESDALLAPFQYSHANRFVAGQPARRQLRLTLDDRVAIVRIVPMERSARGAVGL